VRWLAIKAARSKKWGLDTMLWFIGGIALFVAALLALDWFMARRTSRRMLRSAREGEAGNPNPGYAEITQLDVHIERKTMP
jgi:hypothetical protein